MSATDYFLNPYNWSFIGFLFLIAFILAYLLLFKTTSIQKVLFCTAMVLMYLVLGSPISNLTNYGLHSISMLQHIVLLMVSPILNNKIITFKINR